MHIDLDQIRATAPAWEFTFTIDGTQYDTRPWTLDHATRFVAAKSGADLRSLLADVVVEGKHPIKKWDESRVSDVLSAIVAYRQELGRKNSERIAQAVAVGSQLQENGPRQKAGKSS